MNKDVATKWVAALRSGEYKQATRSLSNSGGFCCLGVLCDLYRKETGRGAWEKPENKTDLVFAIVPLVGDLSTEPDLGSDRTPGQVKAVTPTEQMSLASTCALTKPVREWAGVRCALPGYSSWSLHDLNDSGKTFSQIAEIIETNVEKIQ